MLQDVFPVLQAAILVLENAFQVLQDTSLVQQEAIPALEETFLLLQDTFLVPQDAFLVLHDASPAMEKAFLMLQDTSLLGWSSGRLFQLALRKELGKSWVRSFPARSPQGLQKCLQEMLQGFVFFPQEIPQENLTHPQSHFGPAQSHLGRLQIQFGALQSHFGTP